MKKIFSYFCYAAMAMAAVSFVSCGDDDDIDEPKKEPEAQTVQIYTATLGEGTLDVIDVKLNMYRNGQKQVVTLDNNMMGRFKPTTTLQDFSHTLTYYCASVNGVEGVDSVIAEANVKPNIEEIVASHAAGESFYWAGQGDILKVNKVADGDYSACCIVKREHKDSWKAVLEERNGKIHYENIVAEIQQMLTAK